MSTNITGTLEKIEVKGPFAGKTNKKTGELNDDFDVVELTINDGSGKTIKVAQFTTVDAVLEFEEGDTVHALYNSRQNGNFINNSAIKVSKVQRNNVPRASKKEAEEVLGKDLLVTKTEDAAGTLTTVRVAGSSISTVTSPVPKGNKTTVVSKDTSMEVSGLLQALINTGKHFDAEEQLDLGHLETDLRAVMHLKRIFAVEVESESQAK